MADIKLDPVAIELAVDELDQAAAGLQAEVAEFLGQVKAEENQLEGQLKTVASAFQGQLTELNSSMATELKEAARILREMAELLCGADIKAAKGIG